MILDATALALAICVTIGRGYFALGRDGLLPKVFAKTSRLQHALGREPDGRGRRRRPDADRALHELQPHVRDCDASGQRSPLFPNDEFATFIVSATAGSFVIELVYLILSVVAVRLLVRDNAVWWQYLVVLVAIATPILGFYGALHPSPHDRSNLQLGGALLGADRAGAVGGLVRHMPADVPRQGAHAASHAAEHHGVAPLDENVDFTPAPPDTTI